MKLQCALVVRQIFSDSSLYHNNSKLVQKEGKIWLTSRAHSNTSLFVLTLTLLSVFLVIYWTVYFVTGLKEVGSNLKVSKSKVFVQLSRKNKMTQIRVKTSYERHDGTKKSAISLNCRLRYLFLSSKKFFKLQKWKLMPEPSWF